MPGKIKGSNTKRHIISVISYSDILKTTLSIPGSISLGLFPLLFIYQRLSGFLLSISVIKPFNKILTLFVVIFEAFSLNKANLDFCLGLNAFFYEKEAGLLF